MATLILQHSDTTGSDRCGVILRDHGHRLRIVRPDRGEDVPVDLDGIDAIIVCGAPSQPDGADPWIDDECALLRAADAQSLPIFAICFGCQILARALGGEVEALPERRVGWYDVTLTPTGREDPLFAGIGWTTKQLFWNQFGVTTLPEGARVLATAPGVPVAAWAKGLRTYAVQYHPETFDTTLEAWMAQEPDALAQAGTTADALRAETQREFPAFDRLGERLFRQVALMLMPLDRRFAGIAKALHH